MATVKLSEGIISEAKIASKAFNRSISCQIEYWVKIGKIIEENPDLNYGMIKAILLGQQEVASGELEAYIFDK